MTCYDVLTAYFVCFFVQAPPHVVLLYHPVSYDFGMLIAYLYLMLLLFCHVGTQGSVANLTINLELSPVTGYYICKSGQPISMSPGATLTASNVEIQVFGVVDGKFTGEGKQDLIIAW